ncbi:MAG: lipoprotein [Erysipelotrichaceae bacterium]|nr:lipoprotein [Erysipelotrichaceae bacterium]
MKKIVIIACTVLLLAGCQSATTGKESKVCNYDVGGTKMSYKLEADNDVLQKIDVVEELSKSIIDEKALAELTDEKKALIKKLALTQLGIEDDENITISFEAKEGVVVSTISFDLTKLENFDLSKLGMGKSKKLSTALQAFKSAGIECN